MSRSLLPWGFATLAVLVATPAPVAASAPRIDWERCLTHDPDTGRPIIDPICFFEVLIDRYRSLSAYEDLSRVIHVTRRHGEEPKSVETRIGCEIADGELRVQTPASEIRRRFGLSLPTSPTSPMSETEMKYKLWLAPHMALKFADLPAEEFRPGVDDGFTATEAEEVTIDERPMVHLELKSGDGQSEDCEASFDLYVNPDSLLVERVEGQHRLPDGANFETTVEITPVHADDSELPATAAPAGEPAAAGPVVAEEAPVIEEEEAPAQPGVSSPPVSPPQSPPTPPHEQPREVVGRE